MYADPPLNELESRVAVSNQTVVAAEANYRSALALVREAQASLFPTLSLDPSVTRSRSSAAITAIGGSAGTASAIEATTNAISTTLRSGCARNVPFTHALNAAIAGPHQI